MFCYNRYSFGSCASRGSTLWCLYLLLLSLLSEHFISLVSSELSFGYETETYMSGIINLTYINPVSGILVTEHLQIGKMLPGKLEEIDGIVVHITSNNHTCHYACDKLDTDILPNEPFIALVKYGHFKDQVKLRHVADANAAAVVVYNVKYKTRFIKVEGKGSRITIVVINEKKGEWLANLVDNGTRVMMQIGISTVGAFRLGKKPETSFIIALFVFFIIVMLCFVWIIGYSIQRIRYFYGKKRFSRQLSSATQNVLDNKIPVQTVLTQDFGSEYNHECCAVCIENFQHGELIRTLPCNHCFHQICIDRWLLDQRSCPICKLDILLHFGLIYTGSQESFLEFNEDEFRRPRPSFGEQEIILVLNERRRSTVKVAVPREQTSALRRYSAPSIFSDVEQSFVNVPLADELDVAINVNDPPLDLNCDHCEEKPLYNDKSLRDSNTSLSDEIVVSSSYVLTPKEEEVFEVCDVSFEN